MRLFLLTSSFDYTTKYLAVYRFSRGCVLDSSAGVEGSTQIQAHFILPEINKLAPEAKSGSLAILLVSWGIDFIKICFI